MKKVLFLTGTRADFGKILCSVINGNKSLLNNISMNDIKSNLPRPKDCSLNITKISSATGIEMSNVEDGLKAVFS